VLVVDDNADMRAYLEGLLVDRYDVETAADGVEALAAIRAHRPALVLTDIMMPRLDGLRLLRALRADPATKSIPVVLVSARTGDEAAVEALGQGADDYLSKPFSARELLARVSTHIELVRMRREAAESALKDVFLGLAAHELRTPLASVKLRLDLAEARLHEGAIDGAAKQLEGAHRAMERAEGLATELLSMSAVQSRKLELRREYADLGVICREAATDESASIGRPVTLALPDAPVEAWVDGERISEIVKHLLSNALKFSPPETPVVLSLHDTGDVVLISVRDEGPGIPAEELPHLFDRFFRVPGIEVQLGSRVGLGVGLYIARAIAELHGGRLDVETSSGHGSTFTLSIPRQSA
jgi:signal transduction histidine kinase